MILLDENFPESQRQLLHGWRIHFRQIGYEIGRKGLKDPELIPLLLQLPRLTFFTLDTDLYKPKYVHSHYSLAFVDVDQYEAASFTRRFLKHQNFDTQAKRLGKIVRIGHTAISVWQRRIGQEAHFQW